MINKAREAVKKLERIRHSAAEWESSDIDDIAQDGHVLLAIADTLESELSRCRAETLREAATVALKMFYDTVSSQKMASSRDVSLVLKNMADEAEGNDEKNYDS